MSSNYRFKAFFATLSILGPLSIDAYLPALPIIASALNTSSSVAQQSLSVYVAAAALMNIVHGAASDRFGRRPCVLIALLVFFIGSIGCTLAPNIGTLLLCRVIQGASVGAGVTAAYSVTRDIFDGARAQKLIASGLLFYSIGPAIAPILGGLLLNAFGWRSIFVFLEIYSAVLLVWAYFQLNESHPPHLRLKDSRALLANIRQALAEREFWLLSGAISLTYCAGFLYIAAAPAFLLQHLQVSSLGFSWLFLPLVAGTVIGSFSSGQFATRGCSIASTVRSGFSIMGAAALGNVLVSMAIPPTLPWSIVPIFFYAIGQSLAAPATTLLLLERYPRMRATASSLRSTLQLLGLVVVAGLLVPLVSINVVALAATMLSIFILALCCWIGYSRLNVSQTELQTA